MKVSFGGWLQDIDGGIFCGWQVNLHNVAKDALDKAKFHATVCSALNTLPDGWDGIVNFEAYGTLNGESGYWAIFRMEDYAEPGAEDTLRIEIYKQGVGNIYDTSWSTEFADESGNVGTQRTPLDNGNI